MNRYLGFIISLVVFCIGILFLFYSAELPTDRECVYLLLCASFLLWYYLKNSLFGLKRIRWEFNSIFLLNSLNHKKTIIFHSLELVRKASYFKNRRLLVFGSEIRAS